jgi:hypothetical protein
LTTEITRLLDIVHADQKLYLVFEFLDVDLKRYMEAGNAQGEPITLELCQVMIFSSLPYTPSFFSLSLSHFSAGLYANNASTQYDRAISARTARLPHLNLPTVLVPKLKDSENRFVFNWRVYHVIYAPCPARRI